MTYTNWLLCNFKHYGKYSLQTIACEYKYESSSQTQSKKSYSFLYPSPYLSDIDNKCRVMESSFARSFSTFKHYFFV